MLRLRKIKDPNGEYLNFFKKLLKNSEMRTKERKINPNPNSTRKIKKGNTIL